MNIKTAQGLAFTALKEFNLPADSTITFVKYRENHVFRVDTPAGESLALKLHRIGYRTDIEILTELRYTRELANYGLPVPEGRNTRDGELYTAVTHEGHSRRVSVVQWIHGAEPSGDVDNAFSGNDSATSEDFAAIGTLLARLHRVAESMSAIPGFQRGAWDADGLAGSAPLWGDPRKLKTLSHAERSVVAQAMEKLHADLAARKTDPGVYGMIHGDSTPENVLKTPEGLMLIDFDDFGAGWFLFDLVTALFFYTPGTRYRALKEALLGAYEKVRPLSDAELATWDALMLGRALSYLGWAAERPGDEASVFIEQQVAPWVFKLARAYLEGAPAPYAVTAQSTKENTP